VAPGETATSLTVTATSTKDTDKSGTAMVTVSPPVTDFSYRDIVLATPNDAESVTITGDSAYYSDLITDKEQEKGVFIESRMVTLSLFYIAQYETTYELWYTVQQWALGNGYTFANQGREGHDGSVGAAPTGAKNEPVTYISWRDAVVWCNAYSEMSGKTAVYRNGGNEVLKNSSASVESLVDNAQWAGKDGYRLPTEAEWEYAARGGGTPPFAASFAYTYAGSNNINAVANYNNPSGTKSVGALAANNAQLYDMSGNVFEWCWDGYGSVGAGTVSDPVGVALDAANRVIRGGGWAGGQYSCRVPVRDQVAPNGISANLGFRVVARP
jgi:formylglycine-generating enzyme required for sulfatase activity